MDRDQIFYHDPDVAPTNEYETLLPLVPPDMEDAFRCVEAGTVVSVEA